MIYLLWSMRYGKMRRPNPWGAMGLEWQTASPPPTENFVRTPVVTEETYHYSERGENDCLALTRHLRSSVRRRSSSSSDASDARHVGVPRHGNHVLRRDVRGLHRSIVRLYPDAFALASQYMDVTLGTVNTVVLITSSLTMALAVLSSALSQQHVTTCYAAGHVGLGVMFLVVKMYEYHEKYVEHIVPGVDFRLTGPEAGHMQMLFCFYF